MTDVAESCAPFPLQLHHAHLQLHLLPLPLSLTDTDSTTVLDAHVFSPLHEFGASCPLPEIAKCSAKIFTGITWRFLGICKKPVETPITAQRYTSGRFISAGNARERVIFLGS